MAGLSFLAMKDLEELRTEAASIGIAFRSAAGSAAEDLGTAIDRNQLTARRISADLRRRFLAFRTKLYTLGLYDPVLGSFDSATVKQADSDEIAQQLELVAEKLQAG